VIWSPALLIRISSRPNFDCSIKDLLCAVALRDVTFDRHSIAAGSGYVGGDRLRFLPSASVVNRDMRAAPSEPARDSRTDAAARAGDKAN